MSSTLELLFEDSSSLDDSKDDLIDDDGIDEPILMLPVKEH
jgi:hypothetical protein